MDKIIIRKPNDFHHHLRDGDMLSLTVEHCFNTFKNVIVMPNLVPPITTIPMALQYRERIMKHNTYGGNPLMTLYMYNDLSLETIKDIVNWEILIESCLDIGTPGDPI